MQIYSENNYKQKTDERDFIKIKYTFSSKDIVKKMKRKATILKEYLQYMKEYSQYKKVVSRKHKKLLLLNNKRQITQFIKDTKRGSILLVIREMLI